MESYPSKMNHGTESNEKRDDGADPETHNKYEEIIATLPRSNRRHWIVDLNQYEGFWFPLRPLEGLLLAQDYFKPQPNDVILSSLPKSGTTWLKALTFAILTRSSFGVQTSTMEGLDLKEAFELFCEGVSIAGPYWNNVLGYWRASLESPERTVFIKYEDLKNETIYYVKKMAEFMDYSFSLEEEVNGVVESIINLCSFENLS
ncbi:hypothetical protein RGQ29_003638 [Quercus rubra]|uniref:Sulfotransferase n=1 Tax=Quercus rubra TaxID=3512 RepID=A0AAN7EC93_QUERU|nr:hypothetical protein RGQ29_003638 [Quercus rubra]